MLTVSLTEVRTISIEGCSFQWKICKPDDVVTVEDKAFVRLAPSNYGLAQLITVDNDNVPLELQRPSSSQLTMMRSKGFSNLLSERNRVQVADLSKEQCSLFDDAPVKKARTSRGQLDAQRNAPEVMTLNLLVSGVTHCVSVLRPVQPNDNVFVEYNNDMITAVLSYIRSFGFEVITRDVKQVLPKGIHHRKNKQGEMAFVVKYIKPGGSHGFRKCSTLEDALAFQADPHEAAAEAEPEPHDEALPDASPVVEVPEGGSASA